MGAVVTSGVSEGVGPRVGDDAAVGVKTGIASGPVERAGDDAGEFARVGAREVVISGEGGSVGDDTGEGAFVVAGTESEANLWIEIELGSGKSYTIVIVTLRTTLLKISCYTVIVKKPAFCTTQNCRRGPGSGITDFCNDDGPGTSMTWHSSVEKPTN